MIAAGVFDLPSRLLAWFYSLTHSYAASIALIAVVVMVITAPLTLKSTKGMLEMQRLAPEMRKLQAQYRNDRTKLNEEMMKLYQEHKVNPLSSCLPLLAQMPVFIIMFRILYGLTYSPSGGTGALAQGIYWAAGRFGEEVGFLPRYISHDSELFQSLVGQTEMVSLGLDLAKSPFAALGDELRHGPDLPRAGRRPRRALLRAAADGGGAGRRQPDDVAGPAEADAVPARGLRRLPGVLRPRPGHLLHLPGDPADRPAALHHAGVLRSRRGARPPGPAGQRACPRARQAGRRRRRWRWRLFAQARRDLGLDQGRSGGEDGRGGDRRGGTAAATSAPRPTKRTTEPKNRPTPSGNRPSGRPQRGGRPGGPRSKSAGKRQR